MRRSTAISQVLLLLAFYAVPLIASSSVALPVCCRRDGAHHCAMQERSSGDRTVLSGAVQCPYSLPPTVLTHAKDLFLVPKSVAIIHLDSGEALLSDKASPVLTQLAAGLDNRGPPTLTL